MQQNTRSEYRGRSMEYNFETKVMWNWKRLSNYQTIGII